MSKKLVIALSILRFLGISVITYLLLSPLVKYQHNEQEKPIILIVQDNSQSVMLSADSANYRDDYAQRMVQMMNELSKTYDVHPYLYGTSLTAGDTPSYGDNATNMSDALMDIEQRYRGRNVGAMILTGDGIVNVGQNPATLPPFPYPIYSVALGDTTLRRDATLSNVRFNRIAYLGNQFPIEIAIRATALNGQRQRLSIRHKGVEVFSKTIDYLGSDFSTIIPVTLTAEEAGLQSYSINLSVAQGETSVKNNNRTFNIEVIDGHQKIAILAAHPHPDVAALRRSIEENQNYEVQTFVGNDWRQSHHDWSKDYDLLILHNLPPKGSPFDIDLSRIPVLFIVGSQTDLNQFNAQHTGVTITSKLEKQTEATAAFNKHFTNFTLEDATASVLEQLPPLSAPFGEYKMQGNATSLFSSKIGEIVTEQPLIAVSQQQGVRRTIIFGEGLWRWRLHDYMENRNHDAFSQLIEKILVYTTLQANKERFRVESHSVYDDNEAVIIDAELYDDNFEPTNQPEAHININDAQYVFGKSGQGYRINLGILDTGRYKYSATVNYGGINLSSSGHFIVESLKQEEINLVANHSLLNTLSKRNKGEMFSPSQIDQLPEVLRQRNDIKPIIYSDISYKELINLPLIFILILLLLSTEWILRKYSGEL